MVAHTSLVQWLGRGTVYPQAGVRLPDEALDLKVNEMSVQLTELAAQEIKRVIEQEKLPDSTLLRVAVAGGGCSGLSIEWISSNMSPDDVFSEADLETWAADNGYEQVE